MGNLDSSRLYRHEVIEITNNYIDSEPKDRYIFDSWIAAKLKIGDGALAKPQMDWLDKIGYRKPSYIDSLSQSSK
jgi:hypothetical protein